MRTHTDANLLLTERLNRAVPHPSDTSCRFVPVQSTLYTRGVDMTLTEAYEALMKMPLRQRTRAFSVEEPQEKRDSPAADPAGDVPKDVLPVKWPQLLPAITGDA